MMKRLKPVYRLFKSDVYWERTFRKNLQVETNTAKRISNPTLFFKTEKRFTGTWATYVDDTLHAEISDNAKFSKETKQRLTT